jgi:hypothetical protein
MICWIGILIALVFVASTLKLGLYNAWTMLFNVLIAVYLGIRLGPFVENFIPAGGEYQTTLGVLAVGLVTFVILHGISYAFLIGQFDVTFPHAIAKLGSAVLGFLAGFLVWSFIILLICTTPFSQNKFLKDVGVCHEGFEQMHIQGYLVFWCSALDKLVGSGDNETGAKQAIVGLLFEPTAKSALPATKGQAKGPNANEPNLTSVPLQPKITPSHESDEALPP